MRFISFFWHSISLGYIWTHFQLPDMLCQQIFIFTAMDHNRFGKRLAVLTMVGDINSMYICVCVCPFGRQKRYFCVLISWHWLILRVLHLFENKWCWPSSRLCAQLEYCFFFFFFSFRKAVWIYVIFLMHTNKRAVLVHLIPGLNTFSNNKLYEIYVDYCFVPL